MLKRIKMVIVGTMATAMLCTNVYGYSNDFSHRSNVSFIEIIGNILGIGQTVETKDADHDFSMYDDIYYYEPENLSRYTKFSSKNPDIAPEDVIWLVNANLDRDFYTKSEKIKDTETMPLLVNKYNYLPSNYVPENLVYIEDDKQATAETAEAFKEMKENAEAEGIEINVVSAYRSIDYQKDLYKSYLKTDSKKVVDTYSARAGYSEHHTGRALDLASDDWDMDNFGDTEAGEWVRKNAWKYGFIVRYTEENKNITGYKSEPWHITYVGDEAAEVMHTKDIKSLEEYVEKYVKHKPLDYNNVNTETIEIENN